MFSKRIKVKEVRVYANPWVTNNSFQIDLVGADDNPISGGTRIYDTVDGTLTVGDDFAWYNPQIEPTYCLGILIENLSAVNHVINQVEIDYTVGGE